MTPLLAGLLAFVCAAVLTPPLRTLAQRLHIVDDPAAAPERKHHPRAMPLLGGVAVFLAFVIALLLVLLIRPSALLGGYLLPKHLAGVLLGGTFLMIGGFLDDRRSQLPLRQLIWPVLAVLAVLAAGVDIDYISNPFGDVVRFDGVTFELFRLGGTPYHVVFWADVFAFAWLMVAMYATKLLDGLDGLVSGISVIGMIVIAALSMSARVGQPETAVLAALGAGAFAGFLLYNFHPASIFLGEGGSLFAGFFLGTLAILSGGKIATALLILGVPVLDVLWVVGARLLRNPRTLARADRSHLHHRLLQLGFSHRATVLFLYVVTAVFGLSTLLVAGKAKVAMLGAVAGLMLALGILGVVRRRRRPA